MRTADSLAARGLLEKARDPADGRRWRLALTAEGLAVHARIHAAFVDQVVAAFDSMPQDLRAGLVDGLAAFVAAASVKAETGGGRHLVRP